jgi:hypothetical protein
MHQPHKCEACGRVFSYDLVLYGWSPCRCGGHAYAFCRDDKPGGCGHMTYNPPIRPETCPHASFGYEGTS